MHLALYRKWRPQVFADVYGQDHVTSVLRREVATGRISHAYLFCGSRGTGKTSCAKILAKAVNCEAPHDGEPCGECRSCLLVEDGSATDVLELDAASNNSVENVRDIRDEVVYTPAALRRRVYIIDEVHMLSTAAFNALLKTLEEPPEHVVFILATTEPHKLPATIISRCQRFDFRRVDNASIVRRLTEIAGAEGITLEEGAATLIARLSQGGMRDAISTLELCAGDGEPVTEEKVRAVTGASDRGLVMRAALAVLERDTEAMFEVIDRVYTASVDITVFWSDLVGLYRDMLVIKSTKNPGAYLDLTESELEATAALAKKFSDEALALHSELADEALVRMTRAGSQKRLIAELTLVRMANPRLGGDTSALAERVAALEAAVQRLAEGARHSGQALPCQTQTAEGEPGESGVQTGTGDSGAVPDSEAAPAPAEADKPHESLHDAASPAGAGQDMPADAQSVAAQDMPADSGGSAAGETPKSGSGQAAGSPEADESAPYTRWADVVERYGSTPGCEGEAGFLGLARAYRGKSGFVVVFEAAMLHFVDSPDVKARLAEILSEFEGRAVRPHEIKFTAADGKPAPADGFDDFKI